MESIRLTSESCKRENSLCRGGPGRCHVLNSLWDAAGTWQHQRVNPFMLYWVALCYCIIAFTYNDRARLCISVRFIALSLSLCLSASHSLPLSLALPIPIFTIVYTYVCIQLRVYVRFVVDWDRNWNSSGTNVSIPLRALSSASAIRKFHREIRLFTASFFSLFSIER